MNRSRAETVAAVVSTRCSQSYSMSPYLRRRCSGVDSRRNRHTREESASSVPSKLLLARVRLHHPPTSQVKLIRSFIFAHFAEPWRSLRFALASEQRYESTCYSQSQTQCLTPQWKSRPAAT